MHLTTETLARYLGGKASFMLNDTPFKSWIFKRSVETDLDNSRIDYVFEQDGMDFSCDEDEKVSCIFLYSDESRFFKEGVQDIPFTCNRHEVIARLGSPSKSGGRFSHLILGEYGAWDRFTLPGYALHIEYRLGEGTIKKITLMREDVVPYGRKMSIAE